MWTPWGPDFVMDEAEVFAERKPGLAPRGRPGRLRGAAAGFRRGVGRVMESLRPSPPLSPVREVDEDLLRLAARWRTDRQLARLSRAPRGAQETSRFAVVGDAEPGRFLAWRLLFNRKGAFEQCLGQIHGQWTDLVLQLGDMVSRGLPENYRLFLESLNRSGLRVPYLTVLGNHDRHFPHGRSDASVYQQLFGTPNYAFDRGGARFVVVDTSEDGLTQARLRWLDQILRTKLRKLVFTHKPPNQFRVWTAGGVAGFSKGSQHFLQLMSRHRVSRVYMGHVHGFAVKEHRGVRYVLTGGGGSPLYPSTIPGRFHHHLLVEAGPKGLRETVVRLDGTSFELPPSPEADR